SHGCRPPTSFERDTAVWPRGFAEVDVLPVSGVAFSTRRTPPAPRPIRPLFGSSARGKGGCPRRWVGLSLTAAGAGRGRGNRRRGRHADQPEETGSGPGGKDRGKG